MKIILSEISLKELREFVESTDKHSGFNLKELSLVSLKLRLQFIMKKYGYNDFQKFSIQYYGNKEFQNKVQDEIIPMPSELFRDAECWNYLMEIIKNLVAEKGKISIALCEPGKWADAMSLIILLNESNLLQQCSIDVFPLRREFQTFYGILDVKEFELASLNYNEIIKTNSLEYYFSKTNSVNLFNKELISFVNVIPSFEKNIYSENSYDVVVARNITISYNFSTHEKIFKTYANLLNNNGYLFAGLKESFKWCGDFFSFSILEKQFPVYLKR